MEGEEVSDDNNRSIHENNKHDQHALFIAPNCGLKLDIDFQNFNKDLGAEYKITNIDEYERFRRKPSTTSTTRGVVRRTGSNVYDNDNDDDDDDDRHQLVGWLSPMNELSRKTMMEKAKVGIPKSAKKVCYVYPPQNLAASIDWDEVDIAHLQEEETNNLPTTTTTTTTTREDFQDNQQQGYETVDSCSGTDGNDATFIFGNKINQRIFRPLRHKNRLSVVQEMKRKTKNLQKLAKNERKWAIAYMASWGAFAYFDEKDELLQVNAITTLEKETDFKLHFKGPYRAGNGVYREFYDCNRFQPFYYDVFREIGYIGCAWVDPKEEVVLLGGEDLDKIKVLEENDRGGFLMFQQDKTSWLYLVTDTDHSMIDTSVIVGSLLNEALQILRSPAVLSEMITGPSSDLSLYDICNSGSKEEIRAHLQELVDSKKIYSTEPDSFGWTPLHYASAYLPHDDKLISNIYELDKKAITTQTKNGLLPIHLCCQNNPSLATIEVLAESKKYDSNTIPPTRQKTKHHEFLPIHFACNNKSTSIEVILHLIKEDKESLLVPSKNGWNALHRAIISGHEHAVIKEIVLSIRNDKHNEKYPLILQRGNGMFPIHLACLKGASTETVLFLLDLDRTNQTFHAFVQNSCQEQSCKDVSIFHLAFGYSPVEVIEILLRREVNLRCNGKRYMPHTPDRDPFKEKDNNGMLPLHIACKRHLRFETIEKILCLNRIGLLEQDNLENNPLHYVCGNSNSDERIIELLLQTEKDLNKEKKKSSESDDFLLDRTSKDLNKKKKKDKRLVEMKNKENETPLFIAVKSGGSGAHALLEPENIFLDGLEDKEIREDVLAKDDIAAFLLQNKTEFQESIVNTLAGRRFFPFIFLELLINILASVIYIKTSLRVLKGGDPIFPVEVVILTTCIILYSLRELGQLLGGKMSDYFLDGWNWVEMASIIALGVTTGHLLVLKYQALVQPDRHLFAICGVLLLLQFIFFIRTTFYSFARFVAGVIRIIKGLLPFIVVSIMLLLMFTYSFLVFENRVESCPTFGQCFLFTLEGFFLAGLADFSTSSSLITEILFGLFAVIILLNVVIAIVSNAWEDAEKISGEVYWKSRVELLFQFKYIHESFLFKSRSLSFLFDGIDDMGDRVFSGKAHSFDYVIFVFYFLLGFCTLGLTWPKVIRRSILRTGLSSIGRKKSADDSDEKLKLLENELRESRAQNLKLQSENQSLVLELVKQSEKANDL